MKKQKSLFLLFMALVMMALSPQSVWAAGTKPTSGDGSSGNPYQIASEANLIWFRDAVNGTNTGTGTGVGICGKLTQNITLTSAWTSIGNSNKIYTGTFDGQGHTISGLNLTANAANAGFFGYVNGATIKNFSLAGTVSSGYDNTGSVVGYAKGSSTIQDIVSTVNITMTTAKSHLGGIAGNIENGTSVLGCTYSGTLNAGSSTDSNGGIVGFAHANCSGTIKYCFFNGTVKTTGSGPQMGGILGYTNDESSNFGGVQDCYSCGTLTFAGSDTHANAIVGRIRARATTTINNTYLSGTATRACNTDGPNIPASNKAITISLSTNNASMARVDRSYVNPTSTTPTQLRLDVVLLDWSRFVKWNDNNTDDPRIVSLANDINLKATVDYHYLNLNLSCDSEKGTVTGGGSYVTGSYVTISATAKPGYRFVGWSDGNRENPRNYMLYGDKDLIAEFAPAFTITVSSNNDSWGEAVTHEVAPGVFMINAGANPGYHFVRWNDGNTDAHRYFYTLERDESFQAIFAPDQYTITVKANDGNMGTVSGGGTFDYGTKRTITATPKTHYHFVQWSDGNTNASRQITVEDDATYTATFAIDQHTITVQTNNGNYGTVSGGGTFDYNSSKTITATPNTGYHFVQWNDGVKTASRQISVTGNATYTATFAPNPYTITVNVASGQSDMGTVSGGDTYDYGTQQTITATPEEHYHFVQWNDGDTNASRQITVAGNATYTATFAIDRHTITVRANNNNYGLVGGSGTYNYGTQQTITATPRTGYNFVQWDDGDTNASRQITVNSDASYTATFEPYTLAKAVLNNDTLTFYYDAKDHDGKTYPLNTGTNHPEWFGSSSRSISTVVFDASFADARPTSCYYWFYNCSNLTSIIGLEHLNTSEVTSMGSMFFDCSQLTSLDLSSFNTSSVTSMALMFYGCSKLTSLDLSSFNTSSVTSMGRMFNGCSQLTSLVLSNFNTINVEYMNVMFYGCSKLTSLDLSNFNTEKVEDMSSMFQECSLLQSLDLSSFNTANVKYMYHMFNGCSQLTSLDLSSFNIGSVTNMAYMFNGCSQLTSLTIGNFDMQKVTNAVNMFYGCPALNTLTMKSLPFLADGTFNTQFSGPGKTVNYALELNDNSIVYDGTNNLPSATSVLTSTYAREMSNEWGTVVVPFEIVYNSNNGNYKLYQFESLNVYNIYFSEYTTGDVIAAGTPMAVKAVGSKNAAGKYEIVLEGNGTISTKINPSGDPVTFYMNGTYTALSNRTDIHFIAQNQFWWADAPITIAPFRAWIEEGEDPQPEYSDEPEVGDPGDGDPGDGDPGYAPTRLNIVVINNDEQTATWLDAINATDAKATKVMIDGQMFILKNGQMFDICGRKIK